MRDASDDSADLRELAAAAREGDARAFRDLVVRVFEEIQRWALGTTGDADLADETTQRVLVRLYRHLESYDRNRPFRSWLYRVTRNAALTVMEEAERERARRARLTDPSSWVATSGRRDEDPVGRIHAERLSSLIRTLFAELSERQREVFDLADLQGYRPAEIAEMLEIEPSTVRVHLHAARRILRSEIVKHDPDLRERYGHAL